VKIYIFHYKESKYALPYQSELTKKYLHGLHPNIKMIRHPQFTFPFIWSHHIKILVVDQQIAFLGGFDLCWGRWDTKDHPLVEDAREDQVYLFPGQEYNNLRIKDFEDCHN